MSPSCPFFFSFPGGGSLGSGCGIASPSWAASLSLPALSLLFAAFAASLPPLLLRLRLPAAAVPTPSGVTLLLLLLLKAAAAGPRGRGAVLRGGGGGNGGGVGGRPGPQIRAHAPVRPCSHSHVPRRATGATQPETAEADAFCTSSTAASVTSSAPPPPDLPCPRPPRHYTAAATERSPATNSVITIAPAV